MRWLKRIFGAETALALVPETLDPEALLRAGFDCEDRGDAAGAENLYRQLLERDPAHAEAHYFLGRIAARHLRHEEAIALFQQAVELRPGDATFLLALGHALFAVRRVTEAVEVYRAGVALQPDCIETLNNYAVALIELNRREEARVELERLRALLPDLPQVHFNLAGIYSVYGRIEDAIASYRRALELTPHHATTYSNLLLTLNYSEHHDAQTVFAEHRRFGERFARGYAPPHPDPSWPRRLRIGYVSPDFRRHVVSNFIEPILANHDRSRFETFCYYSHRHKDPVTEGLRALAGHWLDCEDLSDAELAERIRADKIDILVDLAGHTGWNRLATLALKPAPVQATYLGYPNTTGLGAVDYHITDPYADPPGESDRFYTEQPARLPVTYFCYRPETDAPEVGPLPAVGAGTVTFGCFNNFLKISASFLHTAARVLAEVPGSRLLLKSRPLSVPDVAKSARERMAAAGLDMQRVELRGWEPEVRNHLTIYREVDIALDSFPYNGATTTCEAMWMGVPVVTLAGDRHAGRMGASLLNAVGFGAHVAGDLDAFVAICARLAGNMPRLAELRRSLRERMRRSTLMDEPGFVRALEQCYLRMWEDRLRSESNVPAMSMESAAERHAQALHLRDNGRPAEAQAACREILQARPDHHGALELLWDLAFETGTPGAAIDWLVKAIAANERVAAFHHMLGCALQAEKKIGDAIASFSRALALDPNLAKTQNNLGCLLERVGALEDALECYRNAVRLDPRLAQALYNLGNAHAQTGDTKQAVALIEQALAIEPRHADWLSNLGSLRLGRLQLDEAIASFRAALELDPGYERAHANLGDALLVAGRVEEASAAFGRALELKPENADVESALLFASHFREQASAQSLFDRHLAWANRHTFGLSQATAHAAGKTVGRHRLNIGYVLPDFERQAIACFIEPVLAVHDRGRFSVFCYASSGRDGETAPRFSRLCEHWRDISALSDEVAADRIRADGIDILVDLAGHGPGGRLLLFARKPAPVQVSWLGYPNTTGLAAMDFRLTDARADPEGATEFLHTEKLTRLPQGLLCYAAPEGCPEVQERTVPGNGQVTFGCFNDLAKVTPQMIALWSELLRGLPKSRLVLGARGFAAGSALCAVRDQFLSHGIDAGRVDLRAPGEPPPSQLERYAEIDIALDVYPYNGLCSTCEALWMGVPVVTRAGATHVSRVGASILASAGLSELVANTPEEYLEIASVLAIDAGRLRAMHAGLRDRMRSSPLLDAQGFTRTLEAAYGQMWRARTSATPALPAAADPAPAIACEDSVPFRLHIGGQQRKPGWKILDAQPGPSVDYVGNCSDLSRFADESVDEIYASHVIEHLGYRDALQKALCEFHRVLRLGASLRISAPDFEVLCRLFLDPGKTKSERFQIMRLAFGGQMDSYDFHCVGLTFEFLFDYLSAAGFSRIERVEDFGLFEDSSSFRFADTPISLNLIARK